VVTCPDDPTIEVGRTVDLWAAADDDGEIVSRMWEVVSDPPGNEAAPDPPNAGGTMLTPLIAGDYLLRYTVQDDTGQRGFCEVTVTAAVTAGLRLELLWDLSTTPPPPADMDLHLLHPTATEWFDVSTHR
jgi:K319-like protein